MFEESTHTMELERTYPSGAEEWHCPTCGRRMIMQWPPKYKRIVLEPGDENAPHAGGKGGVQMSSAQAMPTDDVLSDTAPYLDDHALEAGDDGGEGALDQESLGPWLKWFGESDLDEAA